MKGLVIAALLAAALSGCRKDIQNTEAVRQGIVDYLAKRPDLVSMDVSVSSVSFRKNEADALVSFRAKNGPPNNGMEMKYVLERNGSRWVVKGRAGSGNPHAGAAPQGMPMDPAHMNPRPGGAATALPPGHPAIPQAQPSRPLQ